MIPGQVGLLYILALFKNASNVDVTRCNRFHMNSLFLLALITPFHINGCKKYCEILLLRE